MRKQYETRARKQYENEAISLSSYNSTEGRVTYRLFYFLTIHKNIFYSNSVNFLLNYLVNTFYLKNSYEIRNATQFVRQKHEIKKQSYQMPVRKAVIPKLMKRYCLRGFIFFFSYHQFYLNGIS